MFDVDAKKEALEPPRVKVDGETYTGRILSAPQIEPFLGRFEQIEGEVSLSEVVKLMRDVYAAAGFPDHIIESIPLPLLPEALEDFFDCQVRAIEQTANRKTRRAMKSTNSSEKPTGQQ